MQGWSLERKIQVAQARIIDWYQAWNGAVYISFSGGKDSTVLLDLVRRIYPNVPAVFCDTGLEYPEIRDFVKTKDNVEWIKPIRYNCKKRAYMPINFRQVIMEYGYPLISKEQSQFIREFRTTKSDKLKTLRIEGNLKGRGKISKIWMPLAYSDIPVSEKCCNVMKKTPAKVYEKRQEDIRILALWPKKANCANLTGLGTDATLLTKIDQPLNHYHFGPTKMCFLIFASLKSHMQAYMVKFERERERGCILPE